MDVLVTFLIELAKRIWLKFALNKGLTMGSNTRIRGFPIFGTEPYLIELGNNVVITHGVTFLTHDWSVNVVNSLHPEKHIEKFGKIIIKDNCFIGINSIILPNITIGPNAIVGAGSVVTKDVPPYTVVAGNPAKQICTIDEYFQKLNYRDRL
jgi:acetyltransferase-like isoleucine patch superfamily enzyme